MRGDTWYVITGGISSGKSTLLHQIEKRGYEIVDEAARAVIDESVAGGRTIADIRLDEKQFQDIVLKRKMSDELSHDIKVVTFFDRGMQDTIAYYNHYGWRIPTKMDSVMKKAIYKKVFLLSPLEEYTQDNERTEGKQFAYEMQQLLRDAYVHYGMEIIDVPVMNVEERVDFVLRHLDQDGKLNS